ncbi:hypothetical protein OHT76_32650 [Streptomyces sp. NBC_00287]|uniref:hypothetical protein n=1 Tax=Streptomyces sp. NBC_00287 TaxID=2975702 RepID=UPI002E2CD352|nr:hypothetical protein [Streptomyces sp. NBC_00287]
MFRRTTARTAVTALAAVLLALQFFAPTASFAKAHTAGHAEAKAKPGIALLSKALREESLTPGHCAPANGPTGPLRTRDRVGTLDSGPQAPERPLMALDPAAEHEPPGAAHHRTSRPSTAHTPAALQVFRC